MNERTLAVEDAGDRTSNGQTLADAQVELCWRAQPGCLVSVRLPPKGQPWPQAAITLLPPEERAAARGMPLVRRREFLGGRLALHTAARALGRPLGPVLRGPSGAPLIGQGLVGSVSHKRNRAVALLAEDSGQRVGVDVESRLPERPAIEQHVLAPHPRENLSGLKDEERWRAVLMRFSLKEAAFKTLPSALQESYRMSKMWLSDHDPLALPERASLHMSGLDGAILGYVWWLDDAVLTAALLTPGGHRPCGPASP